MITSDSITVYGTTWCSHCHSARRVLDEQGVGYTWTDIDEEPEAQEVVVRLNGGLMSVPTIIFSDGSVLVEPSSGQLLAAVQKANSSNGDDLSVGRDSSARGRWHVRTVGAGVAGSVIASLCCLPMATALALGFGLGTVATLGQLLAYQRLFQVAGLAFAGAATWWILRRSRANCALSEGERGRVPLLVLEPSH